MPTPRALLKSVFGYDDFRPGQEEIVSAVLSGAPVLAVMPTGSGKSMCFQLPAIADDGLTVVVSPLIALMRDQVQQMQALGVAAATLNSSNSGDDNAQATRALRCGELRLLYVSPERLFTEGLMEDLRHIGRLRLAIDEAHCISEWGHDFRPEYRDLGRAARMLEAQVIAFTATADAATRDDIVRRLFAEPPRIFLHSFDRPNLDLNFAAKDQPRKQLLRFLSKHKGESGIVYCTSRDRTERLAEYFESNGFPALAYHAGLDADVRARAQDRFLKEDGIVICATVAFGMGVNKPDVRFVAHADMPGSVESYYQEIGRAGRDGLPADTLALYGLDDMAFWRRRIEEKDIPQERKTLEHARFSALANLCESPRCRRQTLLACFDEEAPACGRCDHCRGEVETRDGAVDAQKALSAIYRSGQRFGAGYIADILVGDASEAVRRNGHDGIKTFGAGKDRSKAQWTSILRQLFAVGALKSASLEHGGFAITPQGEDILFGRATIQLRETLVAKRERSGVRPATSSHGVSDELLAALKRKRLELARAQNMPAYMIFADRTLIDMAEKRPATLDEMREVNGVGERKLAAYGEAFLEVLAQAG